LTSGKQSGCGAHCVFQSQKSMLTKWELCTAGYDSLGSSSISHTNRAVS